MNCNLLCLSQALLKLNRKLQPMVDGIDANRKKWQELCSSYQQTRRASVTNQSTEPSQNPESYENPESIQTVKPVENIMFRSKSKASRDLKCRVNKDDKAASAGNLTSGLKK